MVTAVTRRYTCTFFSCYSQLFATPINDSACISRRRLREESNNRSRGAEVCLFVAITHESAKTERQAHKVCPCELGGGGLRASAGNVQNRQRPDQIMQREGETVRKMVPGSCRNLLFISDNFCPGETILKIIEMIARGCGTYCATEGEVTPGSMPGSTRAFSTFYTRPPPRHTHSTVSFLCRADLAVLDLFHWI
ncbi:hypothetical protein NDU88_002938 [Pleurodeles waltl]|uniref:Uncharacterized protein n=1 Tax=Pleurodeles waltl TaxID=8319 RepID=A0AAV7TNB1_PLEWA|nr:hypothetical protein NDU88_002938 [Pleurodeles waltl]